MTSERDVVVPLTWEESGRVMWALRHPRLQSSARDFTLLLERIGQARLDLANNAAAEHLDRLGRRPAP